MANVVNQSNNVPNTATANSIVVSTSIAGSLVANKDSKPLSGETDMSKQSPKANQTKQPLTPSFVAFEAFRHLSEDDMQALIEHLKNAAHEFDLKPEHFTAACNLNNTVRLSHFMFLDSLRKAPNNLLLKLICQIDNSDFWRHLLERVFNCVFEEVPSLDIYLKGFIHNQKLAELFGVDPSLTSRVKSANKAGLFKKCIKENWLSNLIGDEEPDELEMTKMRLQMEKLDEERVFTVDIPQPLLHLLDTNAREFFTQVLRFKNIRDMITQFLVYFDPEKRNYIHISASDERNISRTHNIVRQKLTNLNLQLEGQKKTLNFWNETLQEYPELWVWLLQKDSSFNIRTFINMLEESGVLTEDSDSHPVYGYTTKTMKGFPQRWSIVKEVLAECLLEIPHKKDLTNKEKKLLRARVQGATFSSSPNKAISEAKQLVADFLSGCDKRRSEVSQVLGQRAGILITRSMVKENLLQKYGVKVPESFMDRLYDELKDTFDENVLDIAYDLFEEQYFVKLKDQNGNIRLVHPKQIAAQLGLRSLGPRMKKLREQKGGKELDQVRGAFEIITRPRHETEKVRARGREHGNLYVALFAYTDNDGITRETIKVGFTAEQTVNTRFDSIMSHYDAKSKNLQLINTVYVKSDDVNHRPMMERIEMKFHQTRKYFGISRTFSSVYFGGYTEFYDIGELKKDPKLSDPLDPSTWERYIDEECYQMHMDILDSEAA